ncbi:MAG: radical SAM protein [Proteobacteria bacterium]|nr:radical SAM protein [Pseudomonadota bacterium]
MKPSYLSLTESDFKKRVDDLYNLLSPCRLCPHNCGVDRLAGEKGFCKVGSKPYISSFGPHFGEEPPITGYRGSGTIFFTYCNLRCIYCQNYTISQSGEGDEVEISYLANLMLHLSNAGCHNINLVTPTHQVPFIVEAIYLASKRGLNIPVVYNCGGYESLDTLKILDGIVDIYMPDFKYFDDETAQRLSGIKNYADIAKSALKEMHRQVGDLVVTDGIAVRGLLVRHLILPDNLSKTDKIITFIAEEISKNTYLNLMDQYYPCYRANEFPPLDRRITKKELLTALELARKAGLKRVIY